MYAESRGLRTCPSIFFKRYFNPPLLFCHICASWRDAALKIPYIWTSFTIALETIRKKDPPFDSYILPKTARFLAWWKENLANTAPSFYLEEPARSLVSPFDYNELENTAKFFCSPFFRSARSLHLNVLNQDIDTICSNPMLFENLVELRIMNIQDSRIPRRPPSPFPPSPHLRRLHLSHAESFGDSTIKIYPWSQLTHLYIPRTITFESWVSLIQLCTNLQVAAVISSAPRTNPNSISRFHVPSLRHLVVATNVTSIRPPFTGLLFPVLTALRIASVYANNFTSIDDIEEFLTATPTLTELHFDMSLSFEEDQFVEFDGPLLGGRKSLSMLVPNLRFLVIDYIDPSRNNVSVNIIRLLRSEWLRSGWRALQPHGLQAQRRLELIVDTTSYSDWDPVPEGIVQEVTQYLLKEWPDDAPFEVSIRNPDELTEGSRDKMDVFDEEAPRRGWNEAVQFYETV
ncbi:hypothetical protein BDZ97DRAFT_1312460 [Flammula alnicola]|nr:hypothetical protein BDZ97DRAFT_1312460 [Flammula alnicola]